MLFFQSSSALPLGNIRSLQGGFLISIAVLIQSIIAIGNIDKTMHRFDLNLLVALDALMRERSVSRAALRLGVGQPAMSAALARIRTLFDDPMLIRTPRGMEPTPRALEIIEPLRDGLGRLRAVLDPGEAFDPSTAKRIFRISGGDYVGMMLFPKLVSTVRAEAPHIDLRFRFLEKDRVFPGLDNEDIDLALCVVNELPKRYMSESLFEETFVCIVRTGHFLTEKPLTPELFAAQDHVLVTERGDESGEVDRLLGELGLTRRIVATVPQVSLLPTIIEQTDIIATTGAGVASLFARSGGTKILPVPFATSAWTMSMVWTQRNNSDAGLAWLRATMKQLMRKPDAENLSPAPK